MGYSQSSINAYMQSIKEKAKEIDRWKNLKLQLKKLI
jgi:hypothetical protein